MQRHDARPAGRWTAGYAVVRWAGWSGFAALAVVCVWMLYLRVSNYQAFIHYDPTADYPFPYDPALGHSVPIASRAEGLIWPALDGEWDSAFIELRVESGWLGKLTDPFVDIRMDGEVVRQYMERGAHGRRFINVTPLLRRAPAPGTPLTVTGTWLNWVSTGAALHVLRAAWTPSGPMLVLAPHPDDAEIAAFGLYSQQPAWVVTVTVGDAGGKIYYGPAGDDRVVYLEKARMRVWNSLLIPQMGGVPARQIVNLGYFDGTLDAMHQEPSRPVAGVHTGARDVTELRSNPLDIDHRTRDATWHNLVADMAQLLSAIRPTSIVLPHPRLDTASDHRLTAIALLEALRHSGQTQGQLLLYTNHGPGSEFYPFGPRDGIVSIPPMHTGHPYFQSVLSYPLSPERQWRKGMALQSEYDLMGEAFLNSWSPRRLTEAELTYRRRAVRPNELFFVVNYDHANRLTQ